ncbi:MAG: RNA helicase [Elusimicrobia bacterium RIFOXYD12_FULL_66_9]|nr:MAG: RNA helicase [Elusimicrobia bacterium RIFOXYD12_FULL_66_9]
MGFSVFDFHPAITAGLRGQGYSQPTPIQEQSIPSILEGRDCLGLAQTGTGKTAAFALPILQRLSTGPRGVVRALVVAPTRELAEQIRSVFAALGQHTGLRAIAVYGGVSAHAQAHGLRGRAEIVVACPGRLLDHMGQGTFQPGHIEVLVLDEADQMFDMGFLPDIRKILSRLPKTRQTLLFSATMPDALRGLAHECLKNPVTVEVKHTEPLATVTHALYPVIEHLKTPLLLELIRRAGSESILVFTRTKHRAKRIAQKVQEAGWSSTDLQGNLSQNRRKAAMDGFRSGKIHVLVATDIAARGIDVTQITHVINYDIPGTPEAYTHRIGRTARAAKTGDAYTLVVRDDEGMIRDIERKLGKVIERRKLEGFDYAASPAPGAAGNKPGHPHHGQAPGRAPQAAKGGRSFWRNRRRPR